MQAPSKESSKKFLAAYISGYVDGEGCFSVSFSRRKKLLVGWETKASFAVGQNYNRAEVIKMLPRYFGCGHIRRDYSDKTLKYEVRSIEDLISKIIPHFRKYPLLSGKRKDFELFVQVCNMMKRREHLSPNGLRTIVKLAYKMNKSGTRRYTQREIIKDLDG
jgi:hypothetical protein